VFRSKAGSSYVNKRNLRTSQNENQIINYYESSNFKIFRPSEMQGKLNIIYMLS
jgi:hypothetical protein